MAGAHLCAEVVHKCEGGGGTGMRSAEAYSWGKCNNVTSICRGMDLVKYAVTKGTLTMASTAWMKAIDLILKRFGRKQ